MVWPNRADDSLGPARVLKVAAITGGRYIPSARFRVRQYLPALLSHDVCIEEFQTHTIAYPPQQRWMRPAWAAVRLAEMTRVTLQSRRYDVTLLQREMMSTLATLERWTGRPRVLDVDDAIHLYRGGSPAKTLAKKCDRIICGNSHLAEIFQQWNSDVVVLPTAVDTERYCPRSSSTPRRHIVLGWIGTSANLRYLQAIEPALVTVLKQYPDVLLHVVCDKAPKMKKIKSERMQYTPWSAASRYQRTASASLCGTPRPLVYIRPRLD